MPKIHPEICANCRNWKFFDVEYDHPEDEVGSCRVKQGEVVYGDEEKCESFKSMKHPRVRGENYYR